MSVSARIQCIPSSSSTKELLCKTGRGRDVLEPAGRQVTNMLIQVVQRAWCLTRPLQYPLSLLFFGVSIVLTLKPLSSISAPSPVICTSAPWPSSQPCLTCLFTVPRHHCHHSLVWCNAALQAVPLGKEREILLKSWEAFSSPSKEGTQPHANYTHGRQTQCPQETNTTLVHPGLAEVALFWGWWLHRLHPKPGSDCKHPASNLWCTQSPCFCHIAACPLTQNSGTVLSTAIHHIACKGGLHC